MKENRKNTQFDQHQSSFGRITNFIPNQELGNPQDDYHHRKKLMNLTRYSLLFDMLILDCYWG